MKKEVRSTVLAIMICSLILLVGTGDAILQAQNTNTNTATTSDNTQKKSRPDGLVEDWLDDFEDCEDWRAIATCPLGETKIRKIPGKPVPVNPNEQLTPEINLNDENGVTHADKYVLGIKTYYLDRGFDRVEVLPPNEYIIRGKAREIKIWVLGRKFRHTLYVKLRDYRGDVHKLKIGRMDFWGWKEMSVIVPGWLPQSSSYALLDKNLHFVSFYVESDEFEAPGTFYFYADNLRVVTDLSEFTGDSTIKDTW